MINDPDVAALLNIQHLVRFNTGSLEIDASTTLEQLVENTTVQQFAGGMIATASAGVDSPVQRRALTVGEYLSAATPRPELWPALLALDAAVTLARAAAPAVNVPGEIFASDEHYRRPGDPGRITQVTLAREWANASTSYVTYQRTPAQPPCIVAVAFIRDGSKISGARVAVGGMLPAAMRLQAPEEFLLRTNPGKIHLEAASAAAFESLNRNPDFRANAEEEREITRVLIRQALTAALAGEGSGTE